MNRTEMIAAVVAALKDPTYELLAEARYGALVDAGVRYYSDHRPRVQRDTFALTADKADYAAAPTGFLNLVKSEWGKSRRRYTPDLHPKPWDDLYIEDPLPQFAIVNDVVYLDPAPTAAQIAAHGATYAYVYNAAHVVDADSSTIPVHDDPLVLLFAEREAWKELATRPDESELFVVRYRKMSEIADARLREMLAPRAAIMRG